MVARGVRSAAAAGRFVVRSNGPGGLRGGTQPRPARTLAGFRAYSSPCLLPAGAAPPAEAGERYEVSSATDGNRRSGCGKPARDDRGPRRGTDRGRARGSAVIESDDANRL